MVTIATIKSLYIRDYMVFFREYSVENWEKRMNGKDKMVLVKRIIDEELARSQRKFDEDILDDFLFQRLFYENLSQQYVYRYSNFVFTIQTSKDIIDDFFSKNPDLLLDNLLTNDSSLKDYSLYTTRLEWQGDVLSNVNMLFRLTSINAKKQMDVDCFFGVRIDLVNNMVVLKFNPNNMEKTEIEPLIAIQTIKNILNFKSIQNEFKPYRLNITSLNEVKVRETVFQLFQKSSLEAEELLNKQVPGDVDDKILDFLANQMYMQQPGAEYIAQIKAVIYQEITKQIGTVYFTEGWVFRFGFREGDTTRATSRTEDYGPIYGSKIYWHLKDVIFKEKEMYEVGLHFYLSKNPDDRNKFVLVRLEAKNDTLVLNYFYNQRKSRKDGEHFVLRKINGYLP